jgi:hypothetical protein
VIDEELIEKLDSENSGEYLTDLVESHLDKLDNALEKTLIDDTYLRHHFMLNLSREKMRTILKEANQHRIRTGESMSFSEIAENEWRKMRPESRLKWADFVDKWNMLFYENFTLGELVKAFMDSQSNADFSRITGLSYNIVSKNIVPRLAKMGIQRERPFNFKRYI